MDESNFDGSPEAILKRLEELRCWQIEQQEKLLSKQLSRSELCSMEQRKLCEMFGLSITSTVSNISLTDDCEQQTNQCAVILNDTSELDTENIQRTLQKPSPVVSPINNFSLKELESYGKNNNNMNNIQPSDDKEDKPKQRFLKRGQGLAARFKIHPEKLRIDNLPKYKFANSHKNSKFLRNSNRFGEVKGVEETHFKQISGELKLTGTNSLNRVMNTVPKEQHADIHADQQYENKTPPLATKNFPPSTTWSKVLEIGTGKVSTGTKTLINNSILDTPTMEEKVKKQRQDQRDLQIFELLEQNLNNSGISRDSNVMQELIKYISTVNNIEHPQKRLGAQQELNFNEREDRHEENLVTQSSKRSVRFSDDHTDDNDVESLASTDIDEMDLSKTSTPLTKTAFEMFKKNLFADRMAQDSTLVPQKNNSMQLRNEELKQRLDELQSEIELFRQQNAVLTKSMQEHEIEKLQWEESKNEMIEKLEDERLRQEVCFHDERMKLANEQRKLDKRAKELRAPNRKDREDVTKLKQEIADLQRESASKDQKHVGAQARLRAQIRNMEKDLKEFSMEIDNLRKENKKIESENMRLRRQNNNKMLNEINKNIAKLAPKIELENTAQTNLLKATKPANEANDDDHGMRIRSKSVPNLIQVKEITKTNESDESESDTSSSSSTPMSGNQRSTYFKTNKIKSKSSPNKEIISLPSDQIPTLESNHLVNLKREIENHDGSRDIWYANGNLKKISADEMVIRMLYFNKDVKETNIHEGTVKYYYAEANTWQTTYLDGLEIWEFPDGKTEHQYKDGGIETHFPDGSICTTNPNNMEIAEEWKYVNGTTIVIKRNGDKYLNLPNGQREVTTKSHTRREYPDGTVKIKYLDGSLETRYSNGRIRIRDAAGTLVRDSEN